MPRGKPAVVWSPEAEQDIINIWRYLADHASAATADRQVGAIEAACLSLSESPLRGRRREELRLGLRSTLVGRYVAFYRVTANAIEIVRVLHQSRDIQAIFDEG